MPKADGEADEREYTVPAPHAAARQEGRQRRDGRSADGRLDRPDRAARAALALGQGLDADRAVPRRRGAEGLQVAGRRHPRQAHRADRSADAEEGARRELRHDRAPARPARRQGRARARERPREEGEGRAGDVRAAHSRDHEGVARDRVVPLGGLLPGDDEGAHGRVDRGQDRPAARPEGERDHREADPGRDGAQALPRHRDQAGREGPRRRVHPAETEAELLAALEEIGTDGGNGLDLGSLGHRLRRQPGAETTSSHEAGEAEEIPEVDSPLDD